MVAIDNESPFKLVNFCDNNWTGEFYSNRRKWSIGAAGGKLGFLHRHPNGSWSGSVGSVGYYIPKTSSGRQYHFAVGWDTPYSGENTLAGYAGVTGSNCYELADQAENGGVEFHKEVPVDS